MRYLAVIRFATWLSLGSALSIRALAASPQIWGQYQGDAAHTGYVSATIPPLAITPIWNVTAAGIGEQTFNGDSQVAIDSNNVFISGFGSKIGNDFYYDVLAFDRGTGVENWTQQVPSNQQSTSPPSVANGMVYVFQYGESANTSFLPPHLVGLNASSGANVFSTPITGHFSDGSRPTVDGQQVYTAGSGATGLNAFDATSGSKEWSSGLNQQNGWIPAADSRDVYVYLGPASASPGPMVGTFFAFNRTTGSLDFTILNPADVSTTYHGTVFLGSQNDAISRESNGLVSFDLVNHSVRWESFGQYSGQIAINGGNIFAAQQANLNVLDESTGHIIKSWASPASALLTGNVIVTDNLIFVGTNKGTYAIDRATMATVWSTTAAGYLALSDDLLIISSATRISAFSVPEPSAIILAALGGLALLAVAKRSTRR